MVCEILGGRRDVRNVPLHAIRAIANQGIIGILPGLPIGCSAFRTGWRRFPSCDPNVRDVDHAKQFAVGTLDPRLRSRNIDGPRAISAPRPPNAEEELNTSLLTSPLPHDAACCCARLGRSEIKVPRFRGDHSLLAVSRSCLARCAEGVGLLRSSRCRTLPCTMSRPVQIAEPRR